MLKYTYILTGFRPRFNIIIINYVNLELRLKYRKHRGRLNHIFFSSESLREDNTYKLLFFLFYRGIVYFNLSDSIFFVINVIIAVHLIMNLYNQDRL